MLEILNIKNVTIIDQQEVEFSHGLNILSGETGAGKSIIIDSIGFIMGTKISKDFIRRDQETAEVTALVTLESEATIDFIKSVGVPVDEDNKILIARTISNNGKSSLRINGKMVTLAILKEISAMAIDIHGQFEHQFLIDQNKHIVLLDRFCGDEMEEYKKSLADSIDKYKDISKIIKQTEDEQTTKKLENLRYDKEQIENLNLKPNEEEELHNKIKILNSHKDLITDTNKALELLSSELGAINQINTALRLVTGISNIDSTKQSLVDILDSVGLQLGDVVMQLSKDFSDLDIDTLAFLEERLTHIYDIKRRYGKNIEEILNYHEKISKEIEIIELNQAELNKLKTERANLQETIVADCEKISALRKKIADFLEKEIETSLVDLGMQNVIFKINIEKKQSFGSSGNDNIAFLISPNKGEPLKPLAKIASGGEMSRVMLSIKAALSSANNIETFIFDEIDTGVSGRTAQKVAEKLAIISKEKQILCITHLPQIAAMADRHFLIEKNTVKNETLSSIKMLDENSIISEIARLIGGATITDTTLIAAKEMKEMAKSFDKPKNPLL